MGYFIVQKKQQSTKVMKSGVLFSLKKKNSFRNFAFIKTIHIKVQLFKITREYKVEMDLQLKNLLVPTVFFLSLSCMLYVSHRSFNNKKTKLKDLK